MYVEDAVSAQGPIPVDVNPNISVGELKLQVAEEFNQVNIGRVIPPVDFLFFASVVNPTSGIFPLVVTIYTKYNVWQFYSTVDINEIKRNRLSDWPT